MAKQSTLFGALVALVSSTILADVYDLNKEYKKYYVSFTEGDRIELTFKVTEQVDTCNHFAAGGELSKVYDGYYVADFTVIGTQRACPSTETRPFVFTEKFEVDGSSITIIAPINAELNARALSVSP